MKRILFCALMAAAACSHGGPAPTDGACEVLLSGNVEASLFQPGCVTLVPAAANTGFVLSFAASAISGSAQGFALDASVELGPSLHTGTWSPALAPFRASGSDLETGCSFSAGSGAVPGGAFSLELTRVSQQPEAHGTLRLEEFVHAPVNSDCPGDVQTATIHF